MGPDKLEPILDDLCRAYEEWTGSNVIDVYDLLFRRWMDCVQTLGDFIRLLPDDEYLKAWERVETRLRTLNVTAEYLHDVLSWKIRAIERSD